VSNGVPAGKATRAGGQFWGSTKADLIVGGLYRQHDGGIDVSDERNPSIQDVLRRRNAYNK